MPEQCPCCNRSTKLKIIEIITDDFDVFNPVLLTFEIVKLPVYIVECQSCLCQFEAIEK